MPKEKVLLSHSDEGTRTGTQELADIVKATKGGFKERVYLFVKRCFDLFVSFLMIIILSPILLILALLVKCSSKGPVIYKHKRLGQYGRVINVYKFRSMKNDNRPLEEVLTEEQLEQYKTEFKIDNDPRVTKIGRFMRKTSLDELPQLFNVFIGNMSFVGPRPVVDREIHQYYEHTKKNFLRCKPGITGYWQAYGRSDITYSSGERQQMELYYAANRSLWFDLKILFMTFWSVLFGKGAK